MRSGEWGKGVKKFFNPLKKLFALGYNKITHPDPDRVIFNFSDKTLSDDEKDLLSLGLEFGLNPKPNEGKHFLPFEQLAHRISKSNLPRLELERNIRDLKHTAWKSFEHLKKFGTRPVLTDTQKKTLAKLADDKDIIILRPDKGRGVVLLNKADYIHQVTDTLSDPTKFATIDSDIYRLNLRLEDKLNRVLLNLKNKGKLSEQEYSSLRAKGSSPALLYALPKVHKVNHPLRPILSGFKTHNYKLSKFLNTMLEPWATNDYVIQDTFTFIEGISQVTLPPKCVMASFDVVSLYPNIPLKETIELILDQIFENRATFHNLTRIEFKKLLEYASSDSYFQFNEKVYKIKDGLGMGNPIAGTLANAFMSYHEKKWLIDCPNDFKPIHYQRFIDETFLIFKDPSHSEKFLKYLNSKHSNIKFTCENEVNDSLPFLDIRLSKENGKLKTSVYRKPCFTGLATNFSSFTPFIYKMNLISTLLFRAWKICSSPLIFKSEIEFIKNYLTQNNYPIKLIENSIDRFLKRHQNPPNPTPRNEGKEPPIFIKFNFFGKQSIIIKKEISKIMKRCFPSSNYKFIFVNHTRIKSYFPYKDRMDPLMCSNLIYQYNCVACQASYVGLTSRNLFIRVAEHMRRSPYTNSKMDQPKFSAIREHCKPECSISPDNFKILAMGNNEWELPTLESIYIKLKAPTLNTTELFLKIF